MKLKLVPALAGVQWVRKGFGMLARQPLAFCGMFVLFFVGSLLLLSLPYLGQFLTLALLPTITVGFMLATQHALAGKPSPPTLLLAPLAASAPGRKILWQQGLLYALCALLTMLLADALDGGRLAAWQSQIGDSGNRTEDMASDTALQGAMLLRLLLALPMSALFWHAGALSHWHQTPMGKSLFFSAVACLRNWKAFAVYGLTWGALLAAFALILGLMAALLGTPALASVIAVPAAVAFSAAFYASLYFSHVDCFDTGDAPSGTLADATSPEPDHPA